MPTEMNKSIKLGWEISGAHFTLKRPSSFLMFLALVWNFWKKTQKTYQTEHICFAVDFKERESFMKSLVCVFIHHIIMMSFNNTTEEADFILFPIYSKAQLNIFGLM